MKNLKMLVIINPVSGTGKKSNVPVLAKDLESQGFEVEVENTLFPGHAHEIAEQAVTSNIDIVVVAGGDGTINEAASALINTHVKLGIIPAGSGNGLARHLSIPLNVKKAFKVIAGMKSQYIDAGMVNDHPFFCTAGMGFDAYIGNEFMNGKTRGLYGYVNHVIREYFRYRPSSYSLGINGSVNNQEAFIITIANAGQYGNNAYIAPDANISDGFLDLCVVKNFPKLEGIGMSFKLFARTISKSPYYSNQKIRSVNIGAVKNAYYHLDGEVFPFRENLEVKVLPSCLEVIVP